MFIRIKLNWIEFEALTALVDGTVETDVTIHDRAADKQLRIFAVVDALVLLPGQYR